MDKSRESIMKLQHENDLLKNRCYALSQGAMCMFCPFTCVNRTGKFRREKGEKANNGPSGID